MYSLVKGLKAHECRKCHETIEKGTYKLKDTQDNHHKYYFHLGCIEIEVIRDQLQLWNQALREATA